MKGSKIVITILELALVVLFIVGVLVVTNNQIQPTLVYQYTNKLVAGTVIAASDLQEVKIPKEAITPDFILDAEEVIGKAVITDAYPGEYVIKSRLSEPEDLDVFASMDLEDYVKVVIPVTNATAGGGLINSGDTVDLVFVGEGDQMLSGEDNEPVTYATRFMSDVLVYKVLNGSANEVTNNVEGGPINRDEDGQEIPNTGDAAFIVCAVTQDQMLEIMTRLSKGEIHVVSRFEETVTQEDLKDFYIGTPGTAIMGETEMEKVETRK